MPQVTDRLDRPICAGLAVRHACNLPGSAPLMPPSMAWLTRAHVTPAAASHRRRGNPTWGSGEWTWGPPASPPRHAASWPPTPCQQPAATLRVQSTPSGIRLAVLHNI